MYTYVPFFFLSVFFLSLLQLLASVLQNMLYHVHALACTLLFPARMLCASPCQCLACISHFLSCSCSTFKAVMPFL